MDTEPEQSERKKKQPWGNRVGVVSRRGISEVTVSTERFCARFNASLPGAYRAITPADVRDMTQCGLIGKHGFYGHIDLEIVRGILQYESLRDRRLQKESRQPCNQSQGAGSA